MTASGTAESDGAQNRQNRPARETSLLKGTRSITREPFPHINAYLAEEKKRLPRC